MTPPRIGGSSAYRVKKCPGCMNLCAKIPGFDTDSEFAGEGRLAHKVAELALEHDMSAEDFVGRTVLGSEVEPKISDPVDVYVGVVNAQCADASGQVDLVKRATLRCEQKVTLTGFDEHCAGTCDSWVLDVDNRTLFVNDYKHGAGVPVDAEDNDQLRFYGLGALLALDCNVETIRLTIVQPNCEHPGGEYVRSWDCTPLDLIEWGLEMAAAARKSREPDAPLNAGEWCQFCAAGKAQICPALDAVAEEAAGYEQQDAINAALGETLTEEEMGRRQDLLAPLAVWITNVRRFNWAEAQRGRIPAGYKIVQTKGRRKFVDPDLAMRQAARTLTKKDGSSLTDDDLFKRKALSPNQLEKLVGKKRAEDFIDSNATKSKSVALVPLSDKREAVTPDALSDFADLFEDDDNEQA